MRISKAHTHCPIHNMVWALSLQEPLWNMACSIVHAHRIDTHVPQDFLKEPKPVNTFTYIRWRPGCVMSHFRWVKDIEYYYGPKENKKEIVHVVVCNESWKDLDKDLKRSFPWLSD